MKREEEVKVLSRERLAEDVFSIRLESSIGGEALPGQFVSLYTRDRTKLLPRPISICEGKEGELRLVFRIVGGGTHEFSRLMPGEGIRIIGPLGNGFPKRKGKALIIGGGIGIPPMLFLAESRNKEDNIIVTGFRDGDTFLLKELSENGSVYAAIENPGLEADEDHGQEEKFSGVVENESGAEGEDSGAKVKDPVEKNAAGSVFRGAEFTSGWAKGNVLNLIEEKGLSAKVIYACGPTPMLRAIKEYSLRNGIEAFLSLEERMACGIGACLSCVCNSEKIDDHSLVKNKRICVEGPVFPSEEIIL